MDVVSTKHLAAYTLVAATVANHDASRRVTPPSPSAEPERHFDGAMMIRVIEHGSGQPVPGALVEPGMVVDETGLIGIPFLTSATGEGVVRYPVGRTTRISVSVEKEGYGSGNDSLELEPGPTNRLEVELTVPPKVTGVVRDGAGVPLAGVEMMVWPPWGGTSKGGTTDTNGHFLVIRNLPDGNNPNYEQFLIARDLRRNLAFAQSIEESTTNVDLRLEPGLAVTGRATDAKGKPLPKAEAEIMFWTERMGSTMGKSVTADSEGRFEIKALPPGRHYGVIVSAKGYGRVTHDVAQDAEGRRIELGPFELALADQRIAGVVLGADDKPVTDANIFGYGDGQPSVNGKTDAKGRFSFKWSLRRADSTPGQLPHRRIRQCQRRGRRHQHHYPARYFGKRCGLKVEHQDQRHRYRAGQQAGAPDSGEPVSFFFAGREADRQRRPIHADIRSQAIGWDGSGHADRSGA